MGNAIIWSVVGAIANAAFRLANGSASIEETAKLADQTCTTSAAVESCAAEVFNSAIKKGLMSDSDFATRPLQQVTFPINGTNVSLQLTSSELCQYSAPDKNNNKPNFSCSNTYSFVPYARPTVNHPAAPTVAKPS